MALARIPLGNSKLLSSFQSRPFQLVPLGEADLPGIAAILAKYEGLGIQLADASLAHLANREGSSRSSPWTGATLAYSAWSTGENCA